MTDKKKREPPLKLDMAFEEALARFSRTDPKEIADAFVAEIMQKRQDAEKRINEVTKELEDGARPKKGRFRL